jgi:hypothetical protein
VRVEYVVPAVGNGADGACCFQTLIESWDGSHWTLAASPNTGSSDWLHGVSCVSPGSCEAVGYFAPSGNPEATLIESLS